MGTWLKLCFFLITGHQTFSWATDIPVLDFSDVCLGFESQGRLPHLHATNSSDSLWCNTCWPLCGQHGSWAILIEVLAYKHWLGLSPGLNMPLPYSRWQDRCSTDWAKPAQWVFHPLTKKLPSVLDMVFRKLWKFCCPWLIIDQSLQLICVQLLLTILRNM